MRGIACVSLYAWNIKPVSDTAKLRVLQEHSDGGCTGLYIYHRLHEGQADFHPPVSCSGQRFPIDIAMGPV